MKNHSHRPRLVQVMLPVPLASPFTYSCASDQELKDGSYVTVPFGKKEMKGVVWSQDQDQKDLAYEKIKPIITVHHELPPLQREHRYFLEQVAAYTMAPLGSVLSMTLVGGKQWTAKYFEEPATDIPENFSPLSLSSDQENAAHVLRQAVHSDSFRAFVLHGVTGSGKTEVYFSAVEEILKKEKGQILILLPEIALTSQAIERLSERFGFAPIWWHSQLSPTKRNRNWLRVCTGKERLVIGARSALFLPFTNLKLIIVDEEHDASYKQEEGVMYHARDMAVLRGKMSSCPVILASATPSLETMFNVSRGKYEYLKLPSRYGGALLPTMSLIDMRTASKQKGRFLSLPMQKALKDCFYLNQQSLLYLNRRGYAPLTLCTKCGYKFACHACASWLILHREFHSLQCHYCSYSIPLASHCPNCATNDHVIFCGPGAERIAEEVKIILPEARVELITSDTISSFKKTQEAFERVASHQVDIIIGTQLIAKGHHFPNLTLVGIVDAELGLSGADLRASEHAYQLLLQVAGRAGREKEKGSVLIQTFDPSNRLLASLIDYRSDNFVKLELESRERCHMPPFSRLAGVILSGNNEEIVQEVARKLERTIPSYEGIQVLGPAPAPLYKLRGKFRLRFLVKANRQINLQKFLKFWLSSVNTPSSVLLRVDIDPYNFS